MLVSEIGGKNCVSRVSAIERNRQDVNVHRLERWPRLDARPLKRGGRPIFCFYNQFLFIVTLGFSHSAYQHGIQQRRNTRGRLAMTAHLQSRRLGYSRPDTRME